ncbi:methyl-accepting chemotaxis protein [Alteromonas sp. a30]|uniref:methyl-accepting chemotaxis protein n=1 Tax=Alteromonas sp. a30 TaxID=2730917 RepID=UPI00227DF8ED|nr:methyl-accepting chemotaxis protein [Alteromonas sp. a30]MCY7295924.1 methyl-accepting chemotaxis protein [Alteromonas sp. a30]
MFKAFNLIFWGNMGLSGLSIKTKILLIPTIGTISFVIYLVLATLTASGNVALLDNAGKEQFPVLQIAIKLSSDIEKVESLFNSAVTTGDEEQIEVARKLHDVIKVQFEKMEQISPKTKAQISNVEKIFDSYFSKGENLAKGMVHQTIDFAKLPQLGEELNSLLGKLKSSVKDYESARTNEFESSIEKANTDSARLVQIGIVMGVITITLLFVTAIPIVRGIHSSLMDVIKSLNDISEGDGDLTVRLTTKNADEIGKLVEGFNAFMQKLQTTIREVIQIAMPLSDTATRVKSSADETSHITSEQQKSASLTLQSVNEMNNAVRDIASSASQTAESVNSASLLTKEGAEVVEETISSINELASKINESANVVFQLEQDVAQVSDVLNVIRSIAEQTNLLALNAAIEAARAGEQGRGFAVVADEVRTLASRTQSSTEEIQTTIEKLQSASRIAVSTMNEGTNMVDGSVEKASSAGQSLTSLEQTIENISSMTMTIAAATEEQTVVVKDIVGSVEEIGTTSEATHRTAGDLAEVSNDLAVMAEKLQKLTSGFKA